MLLIENDVIFAFLNSLDEGHSAAVKLMKRLESGGLEVELSSVAFIEMQLVYMSNGLEDRLVGDLASVAALPGIRVLPLTPDIAVAAAYIRGAYGLSFFDSHYAAAALSRDCEIISFDSAYDKVPGLKRVTPQN